MAGWLFFFMDEQELKNKIFTKTFGAYGELKMSRFCNFLHCYYLGILFSRRFFCVYVCLGPMSYSSTTLLQLQGAHGKSGQIENFHFFTKNWFFLEKQKKILFEMQEATFSDIIKEKHFNQPWL